MRGKRTGYGRARRKHRALARITLLATSSAVGLLAAVHPAYSQGVTLTPGAQNYISAVSALSPALGAALASSLVPDNPQLFGNGGNPAATGTLPSIPGITIQAGRNGGPQYFASVNFAQVNGNVVLPQGVTVESVGPVVLVAGATSPLVAQLVGVNFFLQSQPGVPTGTFGQSTPVGPSFSAPVVQCTGGVVATAPACLGPGGLGLAVYNAIVAGAVVNAGTIQNLNGQFYLGSVHPGFTGALHEGAGINLYAATVGSITNSGVISVAKGNFDGFADIGSLPGIFLRSSAVVGNVLNSGTIRAIGNPPEAPGAYNLGVVVSAPAYGVGIDKNSRVGGSLINTGLISATTAQPGSGTLNFGGYNAVGIEVQGVIVGGITNTGTIIGGTAAIDLTQEQAPTTIVQAGGLIQGAINLSANADKLVLTGGVLNGAVTAPAGSAAVVSVPSGMPTLAAGTIITNVASFTQTGGTLVIPLTTNTAAGNFPTVQAGAINLNGTLLASLQTGPVTLANAGSLVFKDVFVSGTPITGSETVTTASFLFNASLVPDAVTANALDLAVSLSPTAEAQTAQVLAQSLRFGLVDEQVVVDTVENRILVGRSEQGPGLAVASAAGDRLAVSDADQQAQVPAGGTGIGAAAWGRAYGTYGNAGATGTLPAFGERRVGVLSGVDWRFDQFVMGGAFHYANTNAPFADGSNTHLDSYEGLVYGGWRSGPAYVTALASGGANDYTISRNMMPFGLTGFATSAPTGALFSAFGEAGYAFDWNGTTLTSYVNLDYIHQHVDAFTEAGAFGALSVAPANGSSLSTTLGLRASTSIDLGSHGTLVPEVRAGWAHEFLDASQTLTAQLAGTAASPFTVVGTQFGRESAVVGVGVSHEFAPGASFFMDYDAQFTGGFNQNSGSVGIKVKF